MVAPGEDITVEGEGQFVDWELLAVYDRCQSRIYEYAQQVQQDQEKEE